MPWPEREIKRFFERRRLSDAQAAPPIRRLVGVRSPSGASARWPVFRALGALTALTIVATVLWITIPSGGDEFESLAEWRPPTEFLLDFSGDSVQVWPSEPWINTTSDWGLGASSVVERKKEK